MIPKDELDVYLRTLEEAADLGRAGLRGEGYRLLTAALERASASAAGEPWGNTLVERYRKAIDCYVAMFEPEAAPLE